MSNDDLIINPKQGWLKVKLHSQSKWHRRYCIIDWDKAILFIASKVDKRYREWIKLLPHIFINEYESSSDPIIEIKSDNEIHLLQFESKKEFECWFLALKRTAYSRVGGGIFGQSLENTHKYSRDKTSPVPIIVRQCCEFLLEYGSTFVGLFRVPGKQSSIKELRDMYDRGLIIDLNNSYSPATISSLLKIYLHSLPEPIIPIKNFDEFFEIGSRFKYNQTNDIDRLKQLIGKTLSGINYAVLAYLSLFLKKLTQYAHETKMDADNLAVTFGSNLIRPSEDLDLNMIKGHNYNLFPLIKVLIDYSEYLFPNNSNEICDQNNESITKSSGFSSFSSLLSSNEQQRPMKINSRSSSMPSIRFTTFSSIDSSNISFDDQLDNDNLKYQSELVIDKQLNNTFNRQQSFITCCQGEENNEYDQINILQKRFSCADIINNDDRMKTRLNILEEKYKSDIPSQILSKSNVSSPIRKTSKKTFANKFGKSITNFKTSVSRAFHPHFSSSENIQYSSCINISSRTLNQTDQSSKSIQSNILNDCLKNLQDEIYILKDLIDKKDNLLNNLTKTSYEERLKYEKENIELKQIIEQLQYENEQLKARYQSDI
ncbi:unnamed protein product [Adineta steineri]|uniref:Rho GTPase activating protein n=1 Tax=Adineta steineri TaxID=433720 RepID=A0A818WPK1_9BILA|nr:unnamed protein product [Adineta steineri]CAF3726726.1 unnamed protein product [Adineta steineri]